MFHGLASFVIDEKAETEVSDDEIAVSAVDLLLKGLFGTTEKKCSNNGLRQLRLRGKIHHFSRWYVRAFAGAT
jgi:hypothetical protein